MEKFEIGLHIASGTFGDVYKGKYKTTGETIAIKVCRPELHDLKECGVPTSLLWEISIIKDINHPNIVKLKDQVISHDNE